MIVRKEENGGFLCIHQTTHALMAVQFCRYWGNQNFVPPRPHTPVMMAIAQHDNGWYEWELKPQLQPDGTPMDFIAFNDQAEKVQVWQRGIDRAWAQHPYAAILISRHASLLYEGFQAHNAYNEANNQVVSDFLAEQKQLMEQARHLLQADERYRAALQPEVIEANTRLLQFGDRASLQVCVPWSNQTSLSDCPVDLSGTYTSIQMRYDAHHITFEPWPYSVDQFEVSMEGYLLTQERFDSEAAYHEALATAPFSRQSWVVHRA